MANMVLPYQYFLVPSITPPDWPNNDHGLVTDSETVANPHNESASTVSLRVKRLEVRGWCRAMVDDAASVGTPTLTN
jgi:hypothetical protein